MSVDKPLDPTHTENDSTPVSSEQPQPPSSNAPETTPATPPEQPPPAPPAALSPPQPKIEIDYTLASAPVSNPTLAASGNFKRVINLLQAIKKEADENSKKAQIIKLKEELQGVKSLTLSHKKLDDADLIILSELLKETDIASLELLGNEIGPEGAQAIAKALKNKNTKLKFLHLMNNKIDFEGATHIIKALRSNTTLEFLHLGGNNLGDEANTLVHYLKKNNKLKDLYVTAEEPSNLLDPELRKKIPPLPPWFSNLDFKKIGFTAFGLIIGAAIGGTVAIALVGIAWPIILSAALVCSLIGIAISVTALEYYDVTTDSNLEPPMPTLSAKVARETVIKCLRQIKNEESLEKREVIVQELSDSLKRSPTLDLSNALLDDEDITNLANTLPKNNSLISLDLSANAISSAGIKVLSKALASKAKQLENLNLNSNKIDAKGVSDITQMLSTVKLKSLILSYNKCGKGVRKLAEQLQKDPATRLEVLGLRAAEIEAGDAMSIAALLGTNKTLKILDLDKNDIGYRGLMDAYGKLQRSNMATEIVTALINNNNTQLEMLFLGRNEIQPDEANEIFGLLRGNKIRLNIDGRMSEPPPPPPPPAPAGPPAPPATVTPPKPESTPAPPENKPASEAEPPKPEPEKPAATEQPASDTPETPPTGSQNKPNS